MDAPQNGRPGRAPHRTGACGVRRVSLRRRTSVSLRIHAGDPPRVVAASLGHTNGGTIGRHPPREFERARNTAPTPIAQAVVQAQDA